MHFKVSAELPMPAQGSATMNICRQSMRAKTGSQPPPPPPAPHPEKAATFRAYTGIEAGAASAPTVLRLVLPAAVSLTCKSIHSQVDQC